MAENYTFAKISYNGTPIGTLWTDNADGIGYAPDLSVEDAQVGVGTVTTYLLSAKNAGIDPTDAFAAITNLLSQNSNFSFEQSEGDEPSIPDTVFPPEQDQYVLVYDPDTQDVVGLTLNNTKRSDGSWVEVTDPDDPAYYGAIKQTTEDSVAIYDKIASENRVPTLTDFEVATSE